MLWQVFYLTALDLMENICDGVTRNVHYIPCITKIVWKYKSIVT